MPITDENIINIRRYLKERIIDESKFVGHESERQQIQDLVQRTIDAGESNSALLIGPRGAGKSKLVNCVLSELKPYFKSVAVLVKLHGLVHTDDRLALKSITSQMNLENAVDGKVFGSFADNLAFLLACLKSGQREIAKSVIFIIEEFDLFCSHHNQTLLYNLFDVSQSAQTPICVLGVSCRLDVIELLEKRVKSRFSHRQVFLFLGKADNSNVSNLEYRLDRLGQFLLIPNDRNIDLSPQFKKKWNLHINSLLKDKNFSNLMRGLLDLDLGERIIKNILIVVISQLSDTNQELTYNAFSEEVKRYEKDDVVQVLQDLSVLELCLIISMKHHCEIYDNDPMNFEMVISRYIKFANANSSIQTVQRPVLMKAFEHLENLELIAMLSSGNSGIQKQYQLFKLLLLPQQILDAVKKYSGLPTEVGQWAISSLL